MRTTASLLLVLVAIVPAQSPPAYVNFESGLSHALRLSPDASLLFAAQTTDNRLGVWSLANPDRPVLLAEIPVGLEPVSVNARTDDEVWVVNNLSDSVSVVSVSARRVIATLAVADEPADVVFAGGKAFVSATASDRVQVFDAITHQPRASIPVFGKDPRALAVDPSGTRVYALIQRSGNRTTIIPASAAPAPPPPNNPLVPAAPPQGIIVSSTATGWGSQIPFTLPDNDVVEIDVATETIMRTISGVGTTNTDLAVDPSTGNLWVANIEARNLVRFQETLQGHCIDSRVTRITTGPSPVVTAFDLNPGINYNILPNANARTIALAEPYGIVFDPPRGRIYVAAQGTDRIGALSLTGTVLARLDVGPAGPTPTTQVKRGPRAMAIDTFTGRLYVLNRLSKTISVIDVDAAVQLAEIPLQTQDPEPAATSDGRRFLYDAKISGNGTMSCAACHIDGDNDGLAWDLGALNAHAMLAQPAPMPPFNINSGQQHPMKGPMMTQTLKGLAGTEPFHWRGDQPDFASFNAAFQTLMGGFQLGLPLMASFAAWSNTVAYPPNPNQPLGRTYPMTSGGASPGAGAIAFGVPLSSAAALGPLACATCHALPAGTNRNVLPGNLVSQPQSFKVPHLRNLYRKTGFNRAPGPQKSGFGFGHDGSIDTLATFLAQPRFAPWPSPVKSDLIAYLMAFDTGTAPAVGHQLMIDYATAGSAATNAELSLLIARAAAGDADLVARGTVLGETVSYLYDPAAQLFQPDRSGAAAQPPSALMALALNGAVSVVVTGVPPGSGQRIARDRDLDGALDGDESGTLYGAGTAGCAGIPTIAPNSEPRVGNGEFAVVASGAAAFAPGLFVLGPAPAQLSLGAITVLVDPVAGPPVLVPATANAAGWAAVPLPIQATPSLAGIEARAQFFFVDPCALQGIAASPGLHLAVRAN